MTIVRVEFKTWCPNYECGRTVVSLFYADVPNPSCGMIVMGDPVECHDLESWAGRCPECNGWVVIRKRDGVLHRWYGLKGRPKPGSMSGFLEVVGRYNPKTGVTRLKKPEWEGLKDRFRW